MRFTGAVLAVMLIAGVMWGVSIRDYTPPTSSLTDADLSASYTYKAQDSVEANAGDMSLTFIKFYESLPFGWKIQSSGGLDYNGLRDEKKLQYSADFRGQVHKYLKGDLFGYFSLTVAGQTDYDHADATAFVGAGYGRYINATSMARALRIQEELQEAEVISGDLEDDILVELAKTIDTRDQYELERDYFAQIQKVLEKSSKIDRLDGVAMYRIIQVLENEVVNDRYYGYNVGMGIGYEISNPYSGDTQDPTSEIFANFAYPFNLRSQFNESIRFETSLTDFGKQYTLTSTTTFSYELSDRVRDVVSYQLVGTKSTDADAVFTHTLTNSFRFYIENKISLNFDLSLIKSGDEKLSKSVGFAIGYDVF